MTSNSNACTSTSTLRIPAGARLCGVGIKRTAYYIPKQAIKDSLRNRVTHGKMTKRLLIQVAASREDSFQIIPVNSGRYKTVTSPIGQFEVSVDVRNFDGCQKHTDNSFYNQGDTETLRHGSCSEKTHRQNGKLPNLRILVKFTPGRAIRGSKLLFGNEFPPLIQKHVPVSLISTGLKFFRWYVNPTVESDMRTDHPYIYSTALSGLSGIGVLEGSEDEQKVINEVLAGKENLDSFAEGPHNPIPTNSEKRWKHFCDANNCESFTFSPGKTYVLVFETNLLKMRDSKYHVAIPTFGSKTFDINVLKYAKPDLDNFDWIMKHGEADGSTNDDVGFVLNFSLVEE